ncbi:arylesterase [Defluviicoccus vanus]|nr:arylesterase [Defluviicoccus vanus]
MTSRRLPSPNNPSAKSPAKSFGGYGCRAWAINAAVAGVILAMAFAWPGKGAAVAEPIRLLAFGDSLTAGYGLAPADAFPAQLQRALQAKGLTVEVINGGVSGDTTAGGRNRLAWTLGSGDAAQPAAAIVELGGNDALRGLDPEAAQANLDAILAELQRRRVPVLLAGMYAPPNLGADYTRRFKAIYPRLAEKYGVRLYPFFLDGVAGVPGMTQPDGIHPTAAGVTEIVRRITPDVVELLRIAAAKGVK